MFTWKPLCHDSWESMDSHWLTMSWVPIVGLHEDKYGLQPIIFSMDGNFTWMKNLHGIPHGKHMDNVGPRWHGGLSMTTLEGRHGGMSGKKLGFTLSVCDLQKSFGYSLWTSSKRGDFTASYIWTNCVWKTSSWNSRLWKKKVLMSLEEFIKTPQIHNEN